MCDVGCYSVKCFLWILIPFSGRVLDVLLTYTAPFMLCCAVLSYTMLCYTMLLYVVFVYPFLLFEIIFIKLIEMRSMLVCMTVLHDLNLRTNEK